MSKKKLNLNIKQGIVRDLSDIQNFVVKNGKEKYLETYDDLVDRLNEAERKIESYIDGILPKGIVCSVVSRNNEYVTGMISDDPRYNNMDMFYTVIEFYVRDAYIGNVVFGIDKSSYNNGTDSINAMCIINIVQDLDDSYNDIVESLIESYKDSEKGIVSIMRHDDFISYLVADRFVEDHNNEYEYIEKLNDVGLPAYFEFVPEKVDEILKLARNKIEMFSRRVSETTKYIVSAIRSDNNNMYVLFNDKESGELKFSYQVDLCTEEEYINVAKGSKLSMKKLEKMVDRFKKHHDIDFLINHVYEIFKIIVYCQTFKKTFDVLPN